MLDSGASNDKVISELVGKGIERKQADLILKEAQEGREWKLLEEQVASMVADGMTKESIIEELVSTGRFSKEEVSLLVEDMFRSNEGPSSG